MNLGHGAPLAPRWTHDELKILRENYARLGCRGVMPLLPRRTEAAISLRASQMGLANPRARYMQKAAPAPPKSAVTRPQYTERVDGLLKTAEKPKVAHGVDRAQRKKIRGRAVWMIQQLAGELQLHPVQVARVFQEIARDDFAADPDLQIRCGKDGEFYLNGKIVEMPAQSSPIAKLI